MNRPIDVPLVGDLRAIVPQLVEALKDTPRTPTPELAGWIKEDAAQLARTRRDRAAADDAGAHRRASWSRRPSRSPRDGIMVRDGGATIIFGWTYSQAKPHDVMWNQNFGHLGHRPALRRRRIGGRRRQAAGDAAHQRLVVPCSTSPSWKPLRG